MEKPVLYYSNKCTHSMELLASIKSKNIHDNFNMYTIEGNPNIPHFVDRVPLLFYDNKVLHDEGLFMYINSLNSKKHEDVNPFATEKTLSDTFSFLDSENDLNHYYLNVNDKGAFEDQKINTPQESSDDSKNTDIEKLMNERKIQNEKNI